MNALLEGIRVLDLTNENGLICGRILSDLGADVIAVEPPCGSTARNIGPFYDNIPGPERSLYWFAYALNKRSITLNIEANDGRALLQKLVEKADVILESFPVGYMKKLGLDYAKLKTIKPDIIMASISPFGQTGPDSGYAGSDLIVQAMSGYLYVCGDPDRPPLRVSLPQSPLYAGGEAAVATLIALHHRDASGEGQYIDVSAQRSMVKNTVNANCLWSAYGMVLERSGSYRVGLGAGTRARQTWPCKDGLVNFVIFGGSAGAATNKKMAEWLKEEGLSTSQIGGIDWDNFDVTKFTQEEWEQLEAPYAQLFLKYPKKELFREGLKRRTGVCPVLTPAELLEFPQLQQRNFWIDVEYPELGASIKYPSTGMTFPGMISRAPVRAPLTGEHNIGIYSKELGLSVAEINELNQAKII
jgi:crotonobetainyl-CoA:carnitine CoA-transferase CaiB-like acyl-CoA transferase